MCKTPLEFASSFLDDTLFMSNQILKRFVKKIIDFHQKFPVEKYFFDVENFQNLKISIMIFENPKIEKSKMLIIYVMKISRFSDFDFSIFGFSKIMIEIFRF